MTDIESLEAVHDEVRGIRMRRELVGTRQYARATLVDRALTDFLRFRPPLSALAQSLARIEAE